MIKLELSLGSNSETAQVGGTGRGQGRMRRSADTGVHAFPPLGLLMGYKAGLTHTSLGTSFFLDLWLLSLAARGEQVTRTGQTYDSAPTLPACPSKLSLRVMQQAV